MTITVFSDDFKQKLRLQQNGMIQDKNIGYYSIYWLETIGLVERKNFWLIPALILIFNSKTGDATDSAPEM